MSALFILLIISLVVAAGFLAAFIWAIRTGQFDDSCTPSIRMLFDNKSNNNKNQTEINP
jgi:cbb3-type cytochrome oxidase maturation protein